jgi:membrane protein implicated in regulation of membrane protease activity
VTYRERYNGLLITELLEQVFGVDPVEIQMWWIWAVLTAVFILGEFFHKGFLLWLGFAAAVSCILSLLNTPAVGQIALFVNLSGILILLERRFKERYRFKTPEELSEEREEPVTVISDNNIFRRTGPVWEVAFNGESFTVKHSIGLTHISNLLINHGQWITCTDLKNISSGNNGSGENPYSGMSNEQLSIENLTRTHDFAPEDIIDRLSLENIKKMRALLLEKMETDNFNDPEERMQILNSIEFINDYLRKNTDVHGRSRKVSDRSEADRKAVSAAINRARNSVKEQKELYTHFKSFILAKGNAFRYLPDRPINWITE